MLLQDFYYVKKYTLHVNNANVCSFMFVSSHHLIKPLFSFEIRDGRNLNMLSSHLQGDEMFDGLMCVWNCRFYTPSCVIRSLMLK